MLLGKAAAEAIVIGHVHKPPIVGVGPAMVGTGVSRHRTAADRQHPRTTMLAGVEKRCHLAFFGARDDDGFRCQIENEEVSRLFNVLRHTGNQPSSRPEPLPFVLHVLARNVPLGGDGAGWRGQCQLPGFAHDDFPISQKLLTRIVPMLRTLTLPKRETRGLKLRELASVEPQCLSVDHARAVRAEKHHGFRNLFGGNECRGGVKGG